MKELLEYCNLCPWLCGVNRLQGKLGKCKTNSEIAIASICNHKGEEPIITGEKGICNVFFAHCNLQCIYCQNSEISQEYCSPSLINNINTAVEKIIEVLKNSENLVGFVSPTHQIPQMCEIIDELHNRGNFPTILYNSNGFDSVEILQKLEGVVDIYLPDFKYSDADLGLKLSKIRDYPTATGKAVREMYRQKGATLQYSENGLVTSGLIIRHLMLPGFIGNSIHVLEEIAKISVNLHISLMSQYYPTYHSSTINELNATLSEDDYKKAIKSFHDLGFHRGWIQEHGSHQNYRPDFSQQNPF